MKSFSSFHPVTLLIYFIFIMSITMFLNIPVLLVLSLLGAWLFNFINNKEHVIRNLLFDCGLFAIVAIANPLYSHKGATILFFLNGKPITLEAIIYGIFMAVMMIAVLNWCKAFTQIMTSDKILHLFGKITPNFSIVFSMALRYIPLFQCKSKDVNNSQITMGLYTKNNYSDKLKGRMQVFSTVLTWSLENAVDTANSMRARGFGIGKRTQFSIFRVTFQDVLLIIASALLSCITIVGSMKGSVEFGFYPKLSTVSTSVIALSVYVSYGLLVMLPFFIDIKEKLKWIYYRSKI